MIVERLEPKAVSEKSRKARFEAVERSQRVLPDREEDVDRDVTSADELGELLGEAPVGLPRLVVDEVLLRLVEHEVELPAGSQGDRPQCIRQRPARRRDADDPCDLVDDSLHRIAAPRAEDGNRKAILAP